MDTIKAINVWDDDYTEPDDIPKLHGECAKIRMELNDLSFRFKDVQYRQARCRRIYSLCLIVVGVLLLVSLFTWAKDLFYERQPVTDLSSFIISVFLIVAVVVGSVSSVIFFSAMSVHSFWAKCANFLRIEKLEMMRLAYIREKSTLNVRLAELEAEIRSRDEIK